MSNSFTLLPLESTIKNLSYPFTKFLNSLFTLSKSIIITPLLERFKELPILLAGYTDWNGQETYNEKLGHQRAQAVADVLSQAGIPTERMETISLGKTCATPNIDKQAAYQDRRCDVVLKKQR